MKVKQLIKLLQKQNPNREVLIATDSEGNSFEIITAIQPCAFCDGEYGMETGLEKLTPALKKEGYSEEDLLEDGKPALVLWP